MLVDSGLLLTKWPSHIPSDGGQIDPGAPDPDYHNMILCPDGSAYFYLEGKAGASAEWYLETPVVPGRQPAMSFVYTPDPDDAANSKWFETDLILCQSGLKNNLSAQNYAGGIQVGTPAAGWAATGLTPGWYSAGVTYATRIAYSVNAAAKQCSVLKYTINGKDWLIPAAQQNIAAEPTGWQDVALIQIQKKLTAAGRAGFFISNLQLEWL